MLAELLRADGAVVSAEQLLETGLGRAHRPVHQRGAGDHHEAAPQARRPAGDRDRARSGVPDPMKTHSTIRARLTLVYGGLFLLAGVVLLAVTYVLVDQRLPQPFGVEHCATCRGPAPPRRPAIADRRTAPARHRPSRCRTRRRADALDSLLTQGGIALVVVAVVAIGVRLAGRRPGAAAAAPDHRDGPPDRRRRRADRGLHERIALTGPHDEIKELADTFDVMLGPARPVLRRPAAVRRQRLARAAHAAGASTGRCSRWRSPAPDASPSRGSSARPCWRSTPGTSG